MKHVQGEHFRITRDQEEREKDKRITFTVSLNEEEQKRLKACQVILQQPKPSTCMKTLAEIGYNVLHDPLTGGIIDALFKNKRNNERQGIPPVEYD